MDYHFSDKATIERMVANDEFLETSEVHGNIYGTSRAAVEKVRASGKVCIIELDVQGAQKLKKRVEKQGNLNFYYMFITAPSLAELERRIRNRGAEDDAKIQDAPRDSQAGARLCGDKQGVLRQGAAQRQPGSSVSALPSYSETLRRLLGQRDKEGGKRERKELGEPKWFERGEKGAISKASHSRQAHAERTRNN